MPNKTVRLYDLDKVAVYVKDDILKISIPSARLAIEMPRQVGVQLVDLIEKLLIVFPFEIDQEEKREI